MVQVLPCRECASLTSGDCGKEPTFELIKLPAPAPTGWICPVCGGGNAPHSLRCPCRSATFTGFGSTTTNA
jgi:hypothetical protein